MACQTKAYLGSKPPGDIIRPYIVASVFASVLPCVSARHSCACGTAGRPRRRWGIAFGQGWQTCCSSGTCRVPWPSVSVPGQVAAGTPWAPGSCSLSGRTHGVAVAWLHALPGHQCWFPARSHRVAAGGPVFSFLKEGSVEGLRGSFGFRAFRTGCLTFSGRGRPLAFLPLRMGSGNRMVCKKVCVFDGSIPTGPRLGYGV